MVKCIQPTKCDCRKCVWKLECVNVDIFVKGECLQYKEKEQENGK